MWVLPIFSFLLWNFFAFLFSQEGFSLTFSRSAHFISSDFINYFVFLLHVFLFIHQVLFDLELFSLFVCCLSHWGLSAGLTHISINFKNHFFLASVFTNVLNGSAKSDRCFLHSVHIPFDNQETLTLLVISLQVRSVQQIAITYHLCPWNWFTHILLIFVFYTYILRLLWWFRISGQLSIKWNLNYPYLISQREGFILYLHD